MGRGNGHVWAACGCGFGVMARLNEHWVIGSGYWVGPVQYGVSMMGRG